MGSVRHTSKKERIERMLAAARRQLKPLTKKQVKAIRKVVQKKGRDDSIKNSVKSEEAYRIIRVPECLNMYLL